jgi:endonuclease/exonuclease/phosphatase family metal-dependent hydrolase
MRLASLNLLHGRSLDGAVEPARWVAAARSLHADVLGLQEVDCGQPRSGGVDQTALIAEAYGVPRSQWHFAPALAGEPGGDWRPVPAGQELSRSGTGSDPGPRYGIGLISRLPVHEWHAVRLPAAPTRAPVLLPRPRPRLMMLRDEPRLALAAVVSTPPGSALPPVLTVVTTHLSFVPGWNIWQLRRLVRRLAPLPGPLVLLGDLNLPGRLPTMVSGWTSLGRALTYPAPAPRLQIDHALVRGPLPGRWFVRAVETPVSDHRALVVEKRR